MYLILLTAIFGSLFVALTWIPVGGIAFQLEKNAFFKPKPTWEKRRIHIRFGWLYLLGLLFFLGFILLMISFYLLLTLFLGGMIGSLVAFAKGGWPELKTYQLGLAKELSDFLSP